MGTFSGIYVVLLDEHLGKFPKSFTFGKSAIFKVGRKITNYRAELSASINEQQNMY